MKIMHIIALALLMSGCANAQPTSTTTKLHLAGEPLPAIRHMIDMKASGDTLMFVFECEDGYGQRFLRRALIDRNSNTLEVSLDMGKRKDGYYISYMPYPFVADNGTIQVIGQDDCEIYTVRNDTALCRTMQYLMDNNSSVPFPISQYAQDVFMTGSGKYVFIGREPNGGRQYAMIADLNSSEIHPVRQIGISPELQEWMPNAGEMAYSGKHGLLAFAYRLHPVIEIFGLDGTMLNTIEVSEPTFDPATLDEADFEQLNPLHFAEISATDDYIYALYRGRAYGQVGESTIYRLDWHGNVTARHTIDDNISKISVIDADTLIGWTGLDFVLISL